MTEEPQITSTSRVQKAFRLEFLRRFEQVNPSTGKKWEPKDVYDAMRARRFMTWETNKFGKFRSEKGDTMNLSIDEISALAQIMGISLEEVMLGDRSDYDLDRQARAMWIRLKDSLERLNFGLLDISARSEEYLRTLAQLRKLRENESKKTDIAAPDDFDEWWTMWELITQKQKPPKKNESDKNEFVESVLYSYTNARLAAINASKADDPKKRERQKQRLNLLIRRDEWNY